MMVQTIHSNYMDFNPEYCLEQFRLQCQYDGANYPFKVENLTWLDSFGFSTRPFSIYPLRKKSFLLRNLSTLLKKLMGLESYFVAFRKLYPPRKCCVSHFYSPFPDL
ncbi:hypothetical protein CEXT_508891 [Caerostris extrusa]|uniref:Uncharacterized protein n=1 Tax=Caerostris extrusa TaxID=172846 RepID=A0AAV4MDU7_CAEEX|nr:hypothetical protein CEXT_508891 [Caerostris extrusa]